MTIREATTEDVEALCTLARKTWVAAFGASMSDADAADHIERNLTRGHMAAALARDTILLAGEAATLVGFVQLGPLGDGFVDADPATGRELKRLYVLSDYQHCGIGSRLMSAALTHPAMDGVQRLYLDVWEKNSDAIRLYERFGFRVVGSRRFEVASGEETNLDLIMMRITGAQP